MAITLRGLVINPPLALAPMVGLSHTALRSLTKQLGGVGLLFTEMLSAKRLPDENPDVSPYLKKSREESPLFYQIYTNQNYLLEPAIEKLEKLGASGVDLNLGCPAPKLKKIGAGQFLLDDKDAAMNILARIRQMTELPVSVKIRIGKEPNRNKLLEFCRMLEGAGVDLITIHARLYGEKFCRRPRWGLLEPVISKVEIPVLVNGGIFTVADAEKCLQESGAAGLMIGRGAVERPWLFREIAEKTYGIKPHGEQLNKESVYHLFLSLLKERLSPERRLGRLKQFTHYYAKNFGFGHRFAYDIQCSRSIGEAERKAKIFFGEVENDRNDEKSYADRNGCDFSDQGKGRGCFQGSH